MSKPYLLHKIAIVVFAAATLGSCKKENGIDNNSVIKRPYGIYVGDTLGSLINTTTGEEFKTLFPPDGYSGRSLVTVGPNILWVKYNTFISINNGHNFNLKETEVTKVANWQSMMLDVPTHNRVYLCTNGDYGIKLSNDNGLTWSADDQWDPNISGAIGNRPTSLTQLKNGILFAFDHNARKLYKRNSKDEKWFEVNASGLPGSGILYLSHMNDGLILTDYTGSQGVYHSEDNGQTWSAYTGLPARALLSTNAPFDEALIVGTDSLGLYILQGGTFISSNNGLPQNAVVRSITGAENVYKNGFSIKYYYVATNQGLYRSEDQGKNWIQKIEGNFTTLY